MSDKFAKKKKDKKKIIARKRACRFCVDKALSIDYKTPQYLTGFLTERGKIQARRNTGNCAFHQRLVVEAIRRARVLALIPITVTHSQNVPAHY